MSDHFWQADFRNLIWCPVNRISTSRDDDDGTCDSCGAEVEPDPRKAVR